MERLNKIKTVAVSGHFNPLHSGHIAMMEQARLMGDRLIVIIANDTQAKNKHGVSFMPFEERAKIIKSLRIVDDVCISVDEGADVSESIKFLSNQIDIFASGCDENHPDAIKELDICNKLGIKAVYNVGGEKKNSSSIILEKYKSMIIRKNELKNNLEFFTPEYFPIQIGMHEPKEDRVSKLHRHTSITEYLYVEKGEIEVTATDENFNNPVTNILKEGDSIILFRAGHSVKLPKGCRVLEVKSGSYSDDKIYA